MRIEHVLLTNDDGIDAFGLHVLAESLAAVEDLRVSVAAPAGQQSATSRSLTLHAPLRVREHGERRWSVSGTPTDTVMVALGKLLRDDPPDAVISGINHGPNLGEDVHYSGTVAGAMEGAVQGLPAVAVSLADWRPSDFGAAAAFAREVLPGLLARPLPAGVLWNVNIPNGPASSVAGVKVTRQGTRRYYDVVNDMVDPRGKPLVWIAGKGPDWGDVPGSDYEAVRDGYVSLTPLRIDMTAGRVVEEMADLAREGLPGAGADDRWVVDGARSLGLTFDGPTRGGDRPDDQPDDTEERG